MKLVRDGWMVWEAVDEKHYPIGSTQATNKNTSQVRAYDVFGYARALRKFENKTLICLKTTISAEVPDE